MKILMLAFFVLSGIASAEDSPSLKYGGFTPQAIADLSEQERYSSVPMSYSFAASEALSEGSELLFMMRLNSLMYPAIDSYDEAIKKFQKDFGDKATGVLTVSQIVELRYRHEFQRLSKVSFPDQYFSNKTDSAGFVVGTMMIHGERIADPVNRTKLSCYKDGNYCKLEQLYLTIPKGDSWSNNFRVSEYDPEFFEIVSWTENTIEAIPSSPSGACRKSQSVLILRMRSSIR